MLVRYKELKRSSKLAHTIVLEDSIAETSRNMQAQEELTSMEVFEKSGLNPANYWIPQTVIVSRLVNEDHLIPKTWKTMESMIPKEMVINI